MNIFLFVHLSGLSEQQILAPGLKDIWMANKLWKLKTEAQERLRGTSPGAIYLHSKE